jgi:hypothetical protein
MNFASIVDRWCQKRKIFYKAHANGTQVASLFEANIEFCQGGE